MPAPAGMALFPRSVTTGTVPIVTFSWENVTSGTVPVVTLVLQQGIPAALQAGLNLGITGGMKHSQRCGVLPAV